MDVSLRSSAVVSGRDRAAAGTADAWLPTMRRYLTAALLGHLVWETAQLPLYTIWYQGSPWEILFAVSHCLAGDLLIASMALLGALLVVGDPAWPRLRHARVAALALAGGFAYTLFSEWLNTEIRGSWTYSEAMPRLPPIGIGLSPAAQWVIIPAVAFWWARRPAAECSVPRR